MFCHFFVKEAVHEYFQSAILKDAVKDEVADDLISRKEVAGILKVSLVTLTDWMKRGLPSHKQRGRVYFIKSEVLQYIRENSSQNIRLARSLAELEEESI